MSDANEIENPPFWTSFFEAQQMDYLNLDAIYWTTGVMPQVIVQAIMPGPNAGRQSHQARGGATTLLLAPNPIAT